MNCDSCLCLWKGKWDWSSLPSMASSTRSFTTGVQRDIWYVCRERIQYKKAGSILLRQKKCLLQWTCKLGVKAMCDVYLLVTVERNVTPLLIMKFCYFQLKIVNFFYGCVIVHMVNRVSKMEFFFCSSLLSYPVAALRLPDLLALALRLSKVQDAQKTLMSND